MKNSSEETRIKVSVILTPDEIAQLHQMMKDEGETSIDAFTEKILRNHFEREGILNPEK